MGLEVGRALVGALCVSQSLVVIKCVATWLCSLTLFVTGFFLLLGAEDEFLLAQKPPFFQSPTDGSEAREVSHRWLFKEMATVCQRPRNIQKPVASSFVSTRHSSQNISFSVHITPVLPLLHSEVYELVSGYQRHPSLTAVLRRHQLSSSVGPSSNA